MKTFFRTVWGILREISDENSYQRYLRRRGREHSAAEWRRFSDERLKRKYMQAKCC